ncbi:MAG TPA: hypothetical protein VG816_12165 [Solirubrobacterales bacterium]|nr:hypothetical protein [Solirubrobacterales bacterium]
MPLPAATAAEFGIAPGGFTVQMLNAEGEAEHRAGSHPDRVLIDFALEAEGTGTSLRDLAIDLPAGFLGDTSAVTPCPRQAHEEGEECPPESQVGIMSFGSGGESQPLYVLEAEPGELPGFTSKSGLEVPFELEQRSDDFGVTLIATDLTGEALNSAAIELWGVPANHQAGPSGAPVPFLTTPSVCGPLEFTLRVRSYEEGAEWLSETAEAGPLTDCQELPFSPRLTMHLSDPVADSPTGLAMTVSVPQEEGGELASAQLRDVSIELPPGIAVSPGAATGLALCTGAQLGLGSTDPATCPAASRVGTVELEAAALPEAVTGAVYLGEPAGTERLRLFVVAARPGAPLKFVTSLQPDPSGQIRMALRDLPQVAIERVSLDLGTGSTALLATPLGCGPVTGSGHFVPYGDGPAVDSTATTQIASVLPGLTCPGPLPFAPQLSIAASSHRAGHVTSLSAVLHRSSGEALPARFSFTMPAGLSTALGAVEACPDSLAAAGACPAASRVGSVQAEVGSGLSSALLSGALYEAGPYGRSPFSMVMTFGGRIGPFDLGTVAARSSIRIDPESGRVTIATDRLPSSVEGMPIRFREIALAFDRPGLLRNPTSCGPHSLDAAFASQEGASASLSAPYPVSGCGRLRFAPRWRAKLLARAPLRRHDHVGVRFTAKFRPADASMRSMALAMPPALKLGVGGLAELCSRADARRSLCPPGSKVGVARVLSPLLGEPMHGSVYAVQPRGEGAPDTWIALSAGAMTLSYRSESVSAHGRTVTRTSGMADLPLSSLTLRFGGPGEGLLSFDASPCHHGTARRLSTEIRARGQNGARHAVRLALPTGARCGA